MGRGPCWQTSSWTSQQAEVWAPAAGEGPQTSGAVEPLRTGDLGQVVGGTSSKHTHIQTYSYTYVWHFHWPTRILISSRTGAGLGRLCCSCSSKCCVFRWMLVKAPFAIWMDPCVWSFLHTYWVRMCEPTGSMLSAGLGTGGSSDLVSIS